MDGSRLCITVTKMPCENNLGEEGLLWFMVSEGSLSAVGQLHFFGPQVRQRSIPWRQGVVEDGCSAQGSRKRERGQRRRTLPGHTPRPTLSL